jgi:hypothetical protein
MEKEPLIKLPWRGRETIESIPLLLEGAQRIEITLPSNYNHALFETLHPGEPPAQLEEIDAAGGPELLAHIAAVSGLEEFRLLTGPLTAARARVRVSSPAKVFIILPGANLKSNEWIIHPEAGD